MISFTNWYTIPVIYIILGQSITSHTFSHYWKTEVKDIPKKWNAYIAKVIQISLRHFSHESMGSYFVPYLLKVWKYGINSYLVLTKTCKKNVKETKLILATMCIGHNENMYRSEIQERMLVNKQLKHFQTNLTFIIFQLGSPQQYVYYRGPEKKANIQYMNISSHIRYIKRQNVHEVTDEILCGCCPSHSRYFDHTQTEITTHFFSPLKPNVQMVFQIVDSWLIKKFKFLDHEKFIFDHENLKNVFLVRNYRHDVNVAIYGCKIGYTCSQQIAELHLPHIKIYQYKLIAHRIYTLKITAKVNENSKLAIHDGPDIFSYQLALFNGERTVKTTSFQALIFFFSPSLKGLYLEYSRRVPAHQPTRNLRYNKIDGSGERSVNVFALD